MFIQLFTYQLKFKIFSNKQILTERIRNRREKVYYSVDKDYEIENEIQNLNEKITPFGPTKYESINKFNKLNNDYAEQVQRRKLNR